MKGDLKMKFEKATHNVYMSCGHTETMDLMTTGEQLKIDLEYYARQGLCKDCWKKLREKRK
jgi:hypothetical protein